MLKPEECCICCDKLNNLNKKKITCPYCQNSACRKCISTHIISGSLEPSCPHCYTGWNDDFLDSILTKTFRLNEYKKHKQNRLFELEKSKITEDIINGAKILLLEKKKQRLSSQSIWAPFKNILSEQYFSTPIYAQFFSLISKEDTIKNSKGGRKTKRSARVRTLLLTRLATKSRNFIEKMASSYCEKIAMMITKKPITFEYFFEQDSINHKNQEINICKNKYYQLIDSYANLTNIELLNKIIETPIDDHDDIIDEKVYRKMNQIEKINYHINNPPSSYEILIKKETNKNYPTVNSSNNDCEETISQDTEDLVEEMEADSDNISETFSSISDIDQNLLNVNMTKEKLKEDFIKFYKEKIRRNKFLNKNFAEVIKYNESYNTLFEICYDFKDTFLANKTEQVKCEYDLACAREGPSLVKKKFYFEKKKKRLMQNIENDIITILKIPKSVSHKNIMNFNSLLDVPRFYEEIKKSNITEDQQFPELSIYFSTRMYNLTYLVSNYENKKAVAKAKKEFKEQHPRKAIPNRLNYERVPSSHVNDIVIAALKKLFELNDYYYVSIIKQFRDEMNEIYSILPHEEDTKKKTSGYKCFKSGCNGVIDSNWKCMLCETYFCAKCGEEKKAKFDIDHVCSEANIATFELIRSDSKPCPNCHEVIFRSEGCSQMWCTHCNTAFDWNTLKIINHKIHNPHYADYINAGGSELTGGGSQVIRDGCNTINVRQLQELNHGDVRSTLIYLNNIINHIDGHEIPRINNTITTCQTLQSTCLLEYVAGIKDEKIFRRKISEFEKKTRVSNKISDILVMFSRMSATIIINYLESSKTSQPIRDEVILDEIDKLIKYANDHLLKISKSYNMTSTISINIRDGVRRISTKSAKDNSSSTSASKIKKSIKSKAVDSDNTSNIELDWSN